MTNRGVQPVHTPTPFEQNDVGLDSLLLQLREKLRRQRNGDFDFQNNSCVGSPGVSDETGASAFGSTVPGPATRQDGSPIVNRPPFASIVVLNLNGEAIIGKCLDHLLAQTYPNYEIIVVDNGSTDGSLQILDGYVQRSGVAVIKSKVNLGIPGGRNRGLRSARGEIIAFMDNDGYADRDWLKEAVRTLLANDDIGAVSSLVFFSRKKIVLNGAGGTIDLRGNGRDVCFNVPYEFANLPYEVLYPMGCGMVVRRSILDRIGPLDPLPVKWFDDAELGIRVWKLGYRVVLSERAIVDHEFNTSDQLLADQTGSRAYLLGRARIRNVLKYYPLAILPVWLLTELKWELRFLRSPRTFQLPLRFWAWNLLHFPSALRWRLRSGSGASGFWRLLDHSWDSSHTRTSNNHGFHALLDKIGSRLILDGFSENHQLNFGWHRAERAGSTSFRWTEEHASVFFRCFSTARSIMIHFRTELVGQPVKMVVRRLGELNSLLELRLNTDSSAWREESFAVCLAPGLYELLVIAGGASRDASGRNLGVAVSSIEFS